MSDLRVCVFGSSSRVTPDYILDASFKCGQLIAEKKLICINGGGRYGVMGAVNRGVQSLNGRNVGIIHEMFTFQHPEANDVRFTEMIVTTGDHLNDRKQELYDRSDCFLVLPGGYGTLDELFDFVCSKGLQLKGVTSKPIVVVNVNGFYDGTVEQLKRCEIDRLLYAPVSDNIHIVDNVEDALNWCEAQCKAVPQVDSKLPLSDEINKSVGKSEIAKCNSTVDISGRVKEDCNNHWFVYFTGGIAVGLGVSMLLRTCAKKF